MPYIIFYVAETLVLIFELKFMLKIKNKNLREMTYKQWWDFNYKYHNKYSKLVSKNVWIIFCKFSSLYIKLKIYFHYWGEGKLRNSEKFTL